MKISSTYLTELVCVLMLAVISLSTSASTVSLTSSVKEQGRQAACSGEEVTFTCMVDDGASLEWISDAFSGAPETFTLFVDSDEVGVPRMYNQFTTNLTQLVPDPGNPGFGDFTSTLMKLLTLKMTLTEKIKTLSTLDEEMVNLLEDESALVEDIEQSDEYKQRLYATIVSIEEALAADPALMPDTARARGGSLPTDASATRVKLPKLTMRPFDGDITKWTSFWDSYESAIHTKLDLTEVDKFNYLRSLLERSARDAISGLTLTTANYKEAIEILHKRFGSKQQIISKHMDILLNLEPATSASAKSLRYLYDRVESNIRGLKSLGVDSKTYGSLLSPVLLSKLPPDIRLIASREISEDDWTLDALLAIVEREVVARERVGGNQARALEKSIPTASALIAGSSQPLPTCCYCQQSHSSSSCRRVTDIEERRKVLKRTGRCYICLRCGHVSRSCRSNNKCYKCKGKHHVSICPDSPKDLTPKDSLSTEPVATSTEGQPSTSKPGLNPNALTFPSSTLLTVANQSILLQTAVTNIYDPSRPQNTLRVRMILDIGSRHSYISNRAKVALHLVPEDECQLAIAAFGSKRSGAQRCEIVRVRMKTRNGPDTELTLLSVPYICEPLSVQPISLFPETYDHLLHLELADASDGSTPMEVDVLIGSDYYWKLMTGEIRRGEDGPVTLHSKLGWVLSGPTAVASQETFAVNLVTTPTLRVDAETDTLNELNDRLHSFWNLESLGLNLEGDPLLEEFNKKMHFKEGRYEVSLPWRELHAPLPTNYQLAAKRLQGLHRRLCQDPAVLREYDAIIRDQIQKGIVQIMKPQRLEGGEKLHYLPHHAVVEIEAIINARPLSYISTDDTEEPLTPSHLLYGCRLMSLPEHLTYCRPLDDEDFEITPAQATRRVKHLNNVLNHFWKRWRQEYLLELRECHRYSPGKESTSTVAVGDIVLLYDDALPRSFWKLATILELIIGRDGIPRGAVGKVPTKVGKTTTLRRLLQLLYPLEVNCEKQHDQNTKTTDHSPECQATQPIMRVQRQAAAEARDHVNACLIELEDSD